MNNEILNQFFNIQSSTIDDVKILLKEIKTQKKNELTKKIQELENQLQKVKKAKRYGLVFEEKPEEFEEKSKKALPLLKEEKDLEIKNPPVLSDIPLIKGELKGDLPTNIIIEGDNYHSLSCLKYTHTGKIDVIYIDPPYNTGNKDFIYNDRFVDKEDSYRHSKWLSFMKKRLILAKDLLSEKGVIFISIDDNEQAQLKILCDETFGEENTDLMIWRKSGEGRDGKMKNTTSFRKDHEYIICCWKSEKNLNKIYEVPNFQNEYGNPDKDYRGPYKAGSISRKEEASNSEHKNYYTVKSPSGKTFTRQFDIPKNDFDKLDIDGRIYWGKNLDAVPAIKIFINEKRKITPYSIFLNKGTTTEGTELLNEIMNIDLTYFRAKPKLLIETLVQLGSKKSSTILDFFAGSGTTGHAVMELNREDSGNRQFILCSNKEATKEFPDKNICKNITYERNKRVIQGYKNAKGEQVQGLGGNLKYYTTDFIQTDTSIDDLRLKFIGMCDDMLSIRENTFEIIKLKNQKEELKLYKGNNTHTVILYDIHYFDELLKLVKTLNGKIKIYIFSIAKEIYEEELENISNNIEIANIPDEILETYKKIFNF